MQIYIILLQKRITKILVNIFRSTNTSAFLSSISSFSSSIIIRWWGWWWWWWWVSSGLSKIIGLLSGLLIILLLSGGLSILLLSGGVVYIVVVVHYNYDWLQVLLFFYQKHQVIFLWRHLK